MGDVKKLKPFMSFNHAAVTENWAKEWGEEPGQEKENWKLLNWTLLADGRIALIYGLRDTMSSGTEKHSINHYRVLVYDMQHGMKLLEKYRLRLEDARLCRIYQKNDEFWTVEQREDSGDYYTLPTWPLRNYDRGYKLFYDVTGMTAKSDGTLVVGYNTQRDKKERVSLIEFGDGEDHRYTEEKVLRCECVNLDSREDEWALMMPEYVLIHFEADDMTLYEMELTGFDAFSLSEDSGALLADFQTGYGDDRLYLMHRRGENYFGDAEECVLDDAHDGPVGMARSMKNWMVFRKGDWLLGVDVNAFTGNNGKEGIGFKSPEGEPEKTEREKKAKKKGQRKQGEGCGTEKTHDGYYKKRAEAPEARLIGFQVA